MKKFNYTLFADGNNETDILQQQYKVNEKLKNVFEIDNIGQIRHLDFGKEGLQMRQTLTISAPNGFTKDAIYTIMNSIKPQYIEFIKQPKPIIIYG